MTLRRGTLVLTAVLLVGVLSLSAAAAPKASCLTVKAGALKGIVVKADNLKPYAKTTLTLVDPETKKVVQKAEIAKDGAYTLKDLKAGKYVLTVAGLTAPIEAKVDGKVSTLNLVVPQTKKKAYAAGQLNALAIDWTTVGVTTGISLAIAVPTSYYIAQDAADDAEDDAKDYADDLVSE